MTTLVYILAAIIVLIIFLAAIAPKTYDVSEVWKLMAQKKKYGPT
ncbi:hypothetical protein [Maribacter litopenaei]